MIVYRITDCRYITDLSGKGASMYGGRWNSKGIYVVYTAENAALALVEAVVHMGSMPAQGYCMASIEIPDDSIEQVPANKLPPGWNSQPPPDYLKTMGDGFVKAGKYLALKLPSVLMMVEHNYLLNPAHPDFKKVQIISQAPVAIDERLFHA